MLLVGDPIPVEIEAVLSNECERSLSEGFVVGLLAWVVIVLSGGGRVSVSLMFKILPLIVLNSSVNDCILLWIPCSSSRMPCWSGMPCCWWRGHEELLRM